MAAYQELERVAVGRRLGDIGGRDVAAGPGPRLDNERLAEFFDIWSAMMREITSALPPAAKPCTNVTSREG